MSKAGPDPGLSWTGHAVALGKISPGIPLHGHVAELSRGTYLQSEGADPLPSHRLVPGEGLGSF